MTDRTTKLPLELTKDDMIYRHPETGEAGRWTVTGPAVRYGDCAEVEYCAANGVHGRFVVALHTALDIQRTPRQELIAGLRAMADWLEATPGVPVAECEKADFQHCVDLVDTTDRRAYVDAVAAEMGVQAAPSGPGHYRATKAFGPVEYRAVSCKPDVQPATAESAVSA